MRRLAPVLLAPVLLAALLAGCGGSSSGSDGGSAAGGVLPKVSGGFGDKPTITIAKGTKAPKKLTSKVLTRGDGPKVTKGDLLVADYLGENFRSKKVFDNSYDRKAPASFPIGLAQVVSGWDKTLVGVPAGSRVVMVLPPKDGYGKSGNADAGIKGTDSLVFVVDVIASYGDSTDLPAPTPVTDLPKDLPTVTGDWGKAPKITVPKGTPAPKKATATVLATGSGEPISKGHLAILHFVVVDQDGKTQSSTWQNGLPQGYPLGGANPSQLDSLIGKKVGSRVLLELPSAGSGDQKTPAIFAVIDIVGQNGTAKEESAS